MVMPIHDSAPLKVIRFQYVTLCIVLGNIIIFLFTAAFRSDGAIAAVAMNFGVVPESLTFFVPYIPAEHPILPPLTLLTHQFLHTSWTHLITNMVFLWVFADNVEDAYGYIGFLLFYLICGIAGALLHVAMLPFSPNPLIGASGAISGVLAAYMLIYPHSRIWTILLFILPFKIPATWVVGLWFLMQIMSLYLNPDSHFAFIDHIGGFSAGLLITFFLRHRLFVWVRWDKKPSA